MWNDALFPLVVICFLSNLARRGERRAKARATAADWKKYICLNPLSCSCYSADRKTRPTADVERVPPDFLAAGGTKKRRPLVGTSMGLVTLWTLPPPFPSCFTPMCISRGKV